MTEPRLLLRSLGNTGLRVTPLALTALLVRGGGPSLSPADVEHAYFAYGINTFFVHENYKSICEGVRRLIAAGHRDELTLVSAASLPIAGSVRRGLEKHLRLLGTDHVDAWLLGWARMRWWVRDSVWSEMQRLRAAGKTRAIGYSSHERTLAAALATELPADVVMIRYNAAHRGAEREVFDVLRPLGARRPGIIAYTATRWGMLLRPQPGFERPMTGGEAYRFVLEHPMVDTVWCAAQTPAELQEDVASVLAGPLDPSRRAEICRFGDAVHAAHGRGGRMMFGARSD